MTAIIVIIATIDFGGFGGTPPPPSPYLKIYGDCGGLMAVVPQS
jgi:hypothetical protein